MRNVAYYLAATLMGLLHWVALVVWPFTAPVFLGLAAQEFSVSVLRVDLVLLGLTGVSSAWINRRWILRASEPSEFVVTGACMVFSGAIVFSLLLVGSVTIVSLLRDPSVAAGWGELVGLAVMLVFSAGFGAFFGLLFLPLGIVLSFATILVLQWTQVAAFLEPDPALRARDPGA